MQSGGFIGSGYGLHALWVPVCAALFLFSAASSIASAQDRWGGSLAVTNDYVYRGLSLSNGQVAYQGGLHLRLPEQWQIGVWASTIEDGFESGKSVQALGFVAHTWTVTPDWDVRAALTHYVYLGPQTVLGYDYDEISVSASYQSQLTLSAAWTPDAARYRFQQTPVRNSASAFDVTWSQPLVRDWSATIGLGYLDLEALYRSGYAYWHIGVTGAVGPVEVDLLHINSGSNATYLFGEAITGPRWTATLRWRF